MALLFWEFVFYPRRAREDTTELEFRRLKFRSSPKIVPHVRKLTVNLVGIGEKLIRNSPSPLVLAFLDAPVHRSTGPYLLHPPHTAHGDFRPPGADPGRRENSLGAFAMLLVQPVAWATRKIALNLPLAPHLAKFKGPAVPLPLVLLGTVPQALTITRGRHEYASEFLHAFQTNRRRAIASVTSLALPIRYPTLVEGSDVLADALSFFPSLDSLSVTVYSRAPSHTIPPAISSRALCERLAKTLSVATALRTVVLHWSLDGDDLSEIVPRLSALEGVLRSAIPNLTSVSYLGRLW
ncbi:hypothetical protein B0H14DRAFT_3711488 [Mycena olivaceomarginata]|nr:hypothetical protein B0H14DRAFT_3711488 [Mycena olivaceomarginata]